MDDRFARLPSSLAEKSRTVRLGPTGVPALMAHPDWETPAPAVLWMHGRTVFKELDPGRYLRWIRNGIAVVAVDLPGHGERFDRAHQHPAKTPDTVDEMLGEIDGVVDAFTGSEFGGVFDRERLAIGGMSAGGITTLRRLCDPHPFKCATVECTTGNVRDLYFPPPNSPGRPWPVAHDRDYIRTLDPIEHIDRFEPIPLSIMHNVGDVLIPIWGQRLFIEKLRERYIAAGADPDLIVTREFDETGAPDEHAGFGRHAAEAKNLQLEFLERHLLGS